MDPGKPPRLKQRSEPVLPRPIRQQWVKAAVFAVCLMPLARLVWLALNGGLGANPIEFITRSTGTWALVGLLLTLAVSPARRLSGIPALLHYRRMLGLFAFFYASLHFLTYVWWDQFFDWAAIVKDVMRRPFVTAGMSAFVLMIPLALTSTDAVMRRLGRHWRRLHRLVYVVAIVAVVHYLWLVKKDLLEPMLFAAVLAALLLLRWAPARSRAAGGGAK